MSATTASTLSISYLPHRVQRQSLAGLARVVNQCLKPNRHDFRDNFRRWRRSASAAAILLTPESQMLPMRQLAAHTRFAECPLGAERFVPMIV